MTCAIQRNLQPCDTTVMACFVTGPQLNRATNRVLCALLCFDISCRKKNASLTPTSATWAYRIHQCVHNEPNAQGSESFLPDYGSKHVRTSDTQQSSPKTGHCSAAVGSNCFHDSRSTYNRDRTAAKDTHAIYTYTTNSIPRLLEVIQKRHRSTARQTAAV